jgi:hypothetical protein
MLIDLLIVQHFQTLIPLKRFLLMVPNHSLGRNKFIVCSSYQAQHQVLAKIKIQVQASIISSSFGGILDTIYTLPSSNLDIIFSSPLATSN